MGLVSGVGGMKANHRSNLPPSTSSGHGFVFQDQQLIPLYFGERKGAARWIEKFDVENFRRKNFSDGSHMAAHQSLRRLVHKQATTSRSLTGSFFVGVFMTRSFDAPEARARVYAWVSSRACGMSCVSSGRTWFRSSVSSATVWPS